jgi:diguanylate cyclase
VKTGSDTDNWREKYLGSLSSLESEQRQFRAMEATLKRLTGRLCAASLGQSPRLDAQIKKLQTTIRRETTSDELDQITMALTEAIQALDDSSAAPPAKASAPALPAPSVAAAQPAKAQPDLSREAIIGDERVRAILAALLAELRRDAALVDQVDALDARLAASMTPDQFPDVLSSLTEMIGQRIRRLEHAKQEIEVLLSHMVDKLDEIGQFVADQNRSQKQSEASSETLNVQLADEMKAMGESVDSAGDLQQIREQVRRRIDSIDQHLQEFQQRETTLAGAMRARSEQMRSRIVELETEANRLHGQLKDEQRLSTIDALTKIPNRLAYEKRIEEELNRWQRFKQPTCIAVWDIDSFKRINDSYGHRAGDRVLHTVAECLAGRIRGTDFLARYGGEEFAMILPGTKLDDAARLIEVMRTAISGIGFHFRGTPVSITISSGVTALQAADSPGSAFDRADKALYQAKESGRNRCVSI